MYIRFGKGCCRIAHIDESDEVIIVKINEENEVYAKSILDMVTDSYPIIGVLYDTVDDIVKLKEENYQKEDSLSLTGDDSGSESFGNTNKNTQDDSYLTRLEGILKYINDNYLSDYYGRLDYRGIEEEDYLDGNSIWDLKESMENFVVDSGRVVNRTLGLQENTGMIYTNEKDELRIDEESIAFIVRTMILKNHVSRLGVEDLLDDKITLGNMLRNQEGYIFVDFGKDVYVLK